jgi:hypothetical protein
MAWYYTATGTSPVGSTISPDVGSVFGSVGFLDFYVNGVELLRQGDKMKEHAHRFVRGGQYKEIPLKEWQSLISGIIRRSLENCVPISGTYFTPTITKRLLSSTLAITTKVLSFVVMMVW